jgi:hypothetical protein
MKSVILISDRPVDLRKIAEDYESLGSVDAQSSLRLVIEGNWGWFAFNLEADLEDEIGEAEVTTIRQSINNPSYVQLEFSSACAVNIAISKFIPRGLILVDNDHGMLWSLEEVKRRIETNEDWLSISPDSPP